MRPPHFGQDITNTQNNNGGDDNDRSRQEQIISRLTQNGATIAVAPAAGKGIIRVVSRCEHAKENNNLGEI